MRTIGWVVAVIASMGCVALAQDEVPKTYECAAFPVPNVTEHKGKWMTRDGVKWQSLSAELMRLPEGWAPVGGGAIPAGPTSLTYVVACR